MPNQKITQFTSINWSSVDAANDVIPIIDVSDPTMSPSGTNKKITAQQLLSSKQDTLGFTPVPETRTLTINGTTQDLSTNRTFTIATGLTIGTTPITSGTVGRILFEGSGNVVQEDSALFWDNTNKSLGIGATPDTSTRLDVRAQGALSTDIAFRVRNSANTFDSIRSTGNNTLQIRQANVDGVWNTDAISAIGDSGTDTYISVQTKFGNVRGNSGFRLYSSNGVTSSYVLDTRQTFFNNNFAGEGIFSVGNTITRYFLWYDNNCINGHRYHIPGQLTNWLSFMKTLGNGVYVGLGDSGDVSVNSGSLISDTYGRNVLSIKNNKPPTITGIDRFSMYSADIVAGNAVPHFRTENGSIIKLYQETTAIGGATFVGNAGTALTDTDTFDGYTLQQVVKALRNLGILA